jgi:hypothetical protein
MVSITIKTTQQKARLSLSVDTHLHTNLYPVHSGFPGKAPEQFCAPAHRPQINADPADTIGVLKAKIEEAHGHPAGIQKIIYSGKVLPDDKTVESCGIKEKDFLVLMVSKVFFVSPAVTSHPSDSF